MQVERENISDLENIKTHCWENIQILELRKFDHFKMPRQSKRRAAAAVEVTGTQASKRQKTSSVRKQPEESKFKTNRLLGWFKSYTTDDPSCLGPDGMEKFCKDLKLDPEDVVMLCIAFKMRAKNMGFFTQTEFVQGLCLQPECNPKLRFTVCQVSLMLKFSATLPTNLLKN